MEQTEAELERFRREWRDEVSRRARAQHRPVPVHTGALENPSGRYPASKKSYPRAPDDQRPTDVNAGWDEIEPRAYHDLEEKQTGRRVGDDTGPAMDQNEPTTALEHYEKAVEKEGQGSLGDSVSLYRKAFRLDDRVHEKYKSKHFPTGPVQSHPKRQNPNPSKAPVTLSNTAHHSLTTLPSSISDLLTEFSKIKITAEPPPTELSPLLPCPLAGIPEEILREILFHLATTDVASFACLAQVCKHLAFLVISEDSIWRSVAVGEEFGFAAMRYSYACTILGRPFTDSDDDGNYFLEAAQTTATEPSINALPLTSIYPTYRHMFRHRPRIRFKGCYISTVNYTRPGASSSTWTWNAPVLIVTYFRYLRFFRDGTVISLLTTSEPQDVVPHLHKEHLHHNHTGNLPQSVMRDALRGRWRLTGNPYKETTTTPIQSKSAEGEDENREGEGEVLIQTEGAAPRYIYEMYLSLTSAGRGPRNNKLAWKGYRSYNRLTDDWAEFGRKNERAFYWSRVRSYDTWE